ncbi:MAG: hypothetical protein J6P05_02410 [Lachnospiraceae bacterium]|nr:hypothetical protein [Lachnospiraceae bacterium]
MMSNKNRLDDTILDNVNGGTGIEAYAEDELEKAGLKKQLNGKYKMNFKDGSIIEVTPKIASNIIQSTTLSGRSLTHSEVDSLIKQSFLL